MNRSKRIVFISVVDYIYFWYNVFSGDFMNYNLNQLRILRQYFDDSNIHEFLSYVNPACSCYKLEILAKAFKSGIDIKDLVNCNVSYECLILLCDAKMKGIDIKGLGNEFVDVDLLSKIIQIKKINPDVDMSFIENLSFDDCKSMIYDYDIWGTSDFKKYRDKAYINKKMIETELAYVENNVKK